MCDLISKAGTLYAAAAASPGAQPVIGRGTAYTMQTPAGKWLVRHYRRGGAVARLLGDRYARIGEPRARAELRVSAAARAAGIPTPEAVAAVAYVAGPFARHDIAVTWIDDAVDLAALLFADTSRDIDAEIGQAAALIRLICARGLYHADLNLKNILLAREGAWVVDLDRCRMGGAVRRNAQRMRRRFVRSLEKWEAKAATRIAETRRRKLIEAFHAD